MWADEIETTCELHRKLAAGRDARNPEEVIGESSFKEMEYGYSDDETNMEHAILRTIESYCVNDSAWTAKFMLRMFYLYFQEVYEPIMDKPKLSEKIIRIEEIVLQHDELNEALPQLENK